MEVSLDLAYAYLQWVRGQDDNAWVVYDKDGERIGSLSRALNESEAMAALRLGREFELKAFNTGIAYGKESQKQASDAVVRHLNGQIASLEAMNLRLSEELERHISG